MANALGLFVALLLVAAQLPIGNAAPTFRPTLVGGKKRTLAKRAATAGAAKPGGSLSAVIAAASRFSKAPNKGPEFRIEHEGGEDDEEDRRQARSRTRRRAGPIRSFTGSGTPLVEYVNQPPSQTTAKQVYSVNGLSAVDTRLADGGNSFQSEPPDQALCVGGGYVLEIINTALRVYNAKTGKAVGPTVSLNSFYGLDVAINRTSEEYGPSLYDPSCLYDGDVKRFLVVVAALEVDPESGDLLGPNYLLISVSKTSNPLGGWSQYFLSVQNDGTDGTPDHGWGPSQGDYPQIGADYYGWYITTNEFDLEEGEFRGVNLYGFDKRALVAGRDTFLTELFLLPDEPYPAFTVQPTKKGADALWPALGSAYFLSTLAVFTDDGTSKQVLLWKLCNTKYLNSDNGPVELTVTKISVGLNYTFPFIYANQKNGSNPFGISLDPEDPYPVGLLDTSDTRPLSLYWSGGCLYGAWATLTQVNGKDRVGAFVVKIDARSAQTKRVGIVAVKDAHVLFPAIAINNKTRGAIGFLLSGPNYFPSHAYVTLDAYGIGPLKVPKHGRGPFDGFTQYDPSGPRNGDYGAGAVDEEGAVYVAGEYSPYTCTYQQWLVGDPDEPVRCNNTRAVASNWVTAFTKLRLS